MAPLTVDNAAPTWRNPRPMRRRIALVLALIAGCGSDRRGDDDIITPSVDYNLRVRAYTTPYAVQETMVAGAGLTWMVAEIDFITRGSRDVPIGYAKFSMETNGASYAAEALSEVIENGCRADALARANVSRYCRVLFRVNAGESPARLYLDANGTTISTDFAGATSPPMLCDVLGPEASPAACTDGCNNDGDLFFDCETRTCCNFVTGCPSDTYCGRNAPTCVMGPEGSLSTCRDTCDNDSNGGADCDEPACCDVLACGPGSFCAASRVFVEPVQFDDAALDRVDANTLPSGSTPCRAPVIADVAFVRDGDTIEIFDPAAGGAIEVVRLIGVDTPELARDGNPAECYAVEASRFTRELAGRRVWLTFDTECRDQFGRLLAYVFVGGHRSAMWQRHLARRGFADVFFFDGNDAGIRELLENDEQIAMAEGVGLYTACP